MLPLERGTRVFFLQFFAFCYVSFHCIIMVIVFHPARDMVRVIENTVVFSLNRSCLTKSNDPAHASDILCSILLRFVHYDCSLYRCRLASHPIQESLPPSGSSLRQTILIQPLSKLGIILRHGLRLHEPLTQLVLRGEFSSARKGTVLHDSPVDSK